MAVRCLVYASDASAMSAQPTSNRAAKVVKYLTANKAILKNRQGGRTAHKKQVKFPLLIPTLVHLVD